MLMNPNVKVSVIIPAFNAEKYINLCLDSVVNQTMQGIEVIVVNDGSTDGTAKLIESNIFIDKRVKVINKKNGGVSSARNMGIKKAVGEYVLFLDADDYINEFMCQKMYDLAKRHITDITICGRVMEYKDGKKNMLLPTTIPQNKLIEGESKRELIYKQFIYMDDRFSSVYTKLYKRKLLIENDIMFDEAININEDWIFNIRAFTCAKRIVALHEPLHHYRVDNMLSLSRQYRNDVDNVFERKYFILKNYLSEWEIADDFTMKRLNTAFCYYIAFSVMCIFDSRNTMNIKRKYVLAKKILGSNVFNNALKNICISEWKLSNRIKIWCASKKQISLLAFFAKTNFLYVMFKRFRTN